MFIQHLDDLKTADKKFIIQNLDAYHLLVKHSAKEEIERKVEDWMDEVRVKLVWKVHGLGTLRFLRFCSMLNYL